MSEMIEPVSAPDATPEITPTALGVAHEVTSLVEAILLASQSDQHRQQVVVCETRVAVALEGWLGEAGQEMVGEVVAGLEGPLSARLAAMHDQLHAVDTTEEQP